MDDKNWPSNLDKILGLIALSLALAFLLSAELFRQGSEMKAEAKALQERVKTLESASERK